VDAVRAKDSVDSERESEETLVADSEAGTDTARLFPSKMIVGLDAVEAWAGCTRPDIPRTVRAKVKTIAKGLYCVFFEIMSFPHLIGSSLDSSPVNELRS
jgi:hypothetical protein